MTEEEVKAPLPEDKPEPKMFNHDAREAIETAFESFEPEERQAEEAAPPVPEDKPEAEAPAPQPESVTTETIESESTQFRTIEDAEKSYRNARLKMQEATERAARLEREVEESRRAAFEAMETARKLQSTSTQAAPQAGTPPLNREELEAKFFEDPVGFMFSMQEAAKKAALDDWENKTKSEREQERRRTIQKVAEQKTDDYFATTYPELKAIEPLVVSEMEHIRMNDQDFMAPLMKTRPKNMEELLGRTKVVVDEAVKRLRGRLPDIGKSLGFTVTGEPIKERLTSGSPPIVPGGGAGPVVRPSAAPAGESNEEYLAGRLKRQESMRASNWRR